MNTYRATNTLNGKFYIGSSVNFERRKKEHLKSKANFPFQNALRKNPEAFEWEVHSDDYDEPILEQALLDMWFGKECCYNLSSIAELPSGTAGRTWWKNELTQEQKPCFDKPDGEGWEKGRFPHTEKTKKKMSEAQSGEKNHQFGVPRTEESKKKQSVTNTGKNTGVLHPGSKAIIAIEPDGTQRHYGSIGEAARDLEIAQNNLSNRYLKTGHVLTQGPFKGWQFLFENP